MIRKSPRRVEENSTLPGLYSRIDGSRALVRLIASWISQGLEFAFLNILAVTLLWAPQLASQEAQSAKPAGAILRGTVHDRSGKLMGDVRVVLREESSGASRETSSDSAGGFTFTGVAMGTFTLAADSGRLRSAVVSRIVSAAGEQPAIDLILDASSGQTSGSAPEDADHAMQFADRPGFTIASVIDWTAAGGHGSDANLRASEALTQEALKLGPEDTKPGAVEPPVAMNGAKDSESTLRAAIEKNPKDFAANHRLGLFYLQAHRYQDAVHSLQAAYQVNPAGFDNEYYLARALQMAGDAVQARNHVRLLLALRQTADLHRIEGELDEELDDPLSAVHEFQEAASEDPIEENYFAWGSELLIHGAIPQAKEVFNEGARLYPQSARMLAARGAALFAGNHYDEAALDLCKASDLSPEIVEPYLSIGKIEIAAPSPLPCVLEKLTRFEKLQPQNPLANYYYAMALWKQQGQVTDVQTMERVKDLLTQAVILDPKCADANLELGILNASQKQWEQAISHYLSAIQANPKLNEAHYRLGVAYMRIDQNAKAQEQFQLHTAIARELASETEQQRKEVKQFVVALPEQADKHQTP